MAPGVAGALTRPSESTVQAAVALVLVALCLPAIVGFAAGVVDAPLIEALARPAPWRLLGRSLGLASAVALLSLAIGTPLGLLLGRADVPWRRVALWLHGLPAALPPLVLALGSWELLSTSELASTLRGLGGVLALEVLAFTPVVTLLVASASASVDPAQIDAARAVARPGLTLVRVVLPAARPAATLGALVVAALSLAELGVPAFLGVDVHATAVFARLGGADAAAGEAVALVLPLVLVAVGLAGLERRFAGQRALDSLGLRRAGAALPLGRWRAPLSLIVWSLALAPWVPLAALAWSARMLTIDELTQWIGGSLRASVIVGLAVATTVLVLALVLGHALGRGRSVGRLLDGPSVALLVIPGGAVGLAYASAATRPPLAAVQGTYLPLILALVARYGVLATRAVAVSVRQGSPRLEEAAACFGASYLRRLRDVVVPVHARALALAWALVFVAAVRDLETTALLYPPGGDPLVVRLFTLEANGPPHVLAGLGLAQLLLAAGAVGAVALLGPRSAS